MKIVLVSIVDPREQLGGAWTTSRGLVRMIGEGVGNADIVVIPTAERGRWAHAIAQATSLVRSYLGGLPAKIGFSRTAEMEAKVRRAMQDAPPDLLILDGSDLAWILEIVPKSIPVIVISHNLEFQLYHSQIGRLPWPLSWLSGLLHADARKLEEYELRTYREAGRVVFLSGHDAAESARLIPETHRILVPPSFNGAVPARRTLDPAKVHLGLLANFHWWPNRQGWAWFTSNVLPSLPRHCSVHLFGRGSEGMAHALPSVFGHGYVNSVADAYSQCDLMIVPILGGGGVCIKVAEALYHRMPILATSHAVRGLPIPPPGCIALRNTAAEWVDLLHSPELFDLARTVVPESVADRFSIQANRDLLGAFLSDAVDSAAANKSS